MSIERKESNESKKLKKNSQLIIRLNKEEKDSFILLCEENDTSAAREIRRFIRKSLANPQDLS